jgi:hypothetical protein
VLAVVLAASFVFYSFVEAPRPLSSCPQPENFVKTAQASKSISFAWTPAQGVSTYALMYIRHEPPGGYQSAWFATTENCYTFSGLDAGSYSFYLVSQCGEETSGFIVTQDIIND